MRRSTAGTSTARCSKQAGENTSPGAPGVAWRARCAGYFPAPQPTSGSPAGSPAGPQAVAARRTTLPPPCNNTRPRSAPRRRAWLFCASTQAVAVQAFAVQGIGHPGVCHVGVCHVGVGCCSTFLTTEYVGQHQPPWGQLGVRTCSIVFILNVQAQEQSRFTLRSGNAAALCDI